jgi:hypothetical protein
MLIVGSALCHWALKLLLKTSWNGESTDDWGTLHGDLDSRLKELVAAVT